MLIGDDIKTVDVCHGLRLLSCSKLVEWKSKQTDVDDRPEPMPSPINNPAYLFHTIAAMASLLCRLQILVGLEFKQSILTVVHTVRELQLWTKNIEWSHPRAAIVFHFKKNWTKSLFSTNITIVITDFVKMFWGWDQVENSFWDKATFIFEQFKVAWSGTTVKWKAKWHYYYNWDFNFWWFNKKQEFWLKKYSTISLFL